MPNLKAECYLDNHALTTPLPEVLKETSLLYSKGRGALSAPHKWGKESHGRAEKAVVSIYQTFGAKEEDHFVLTSGDRESYSRLLFSLYLELTKESGKNHFLITPFAEAPLISTLNQLESLNCFGKTAPLTSTGLVDLNQLESLLRPRTLLFSLPLSCGLTGVIQPVEEIVKICRAKNVLLHLDVSSSIGKIDFSFANLNADFISFDGGRIHALPDTGGFFIRKGVFTSCFQTPDAHLSDVALQSLSVASKTAFERKDGNSMELARLRDLFEKEIVCSIGAAVCFQDSLRLPNVSTLVFPNIESEALLFLLSCKNVFASIGGGYSPRLNHILSASGIDKQKALSALSFNLSSSTSEEEITYAAKCVIASWNKLCFIRGKL